MKVVKQSYKIEHLDDPQTIISLIEKAGRTCYKSEDKIANNTAENFIRAIIKRGHESVLEHSSVTVRFVTSRQVSHELVRHRVASYSQESTRYNGYDKEKYGSELTFIEPGFGNPVASDCGPYYVWLTAMEQIESAYMNLRSQGIQPQQAALILPNSLKTEIVMTCNLRELRHIFRMRCSRAAHPQMQELMWPLLEDMVEKLPCLFEDILVELTPGGVQCNS